MTRSGWLLCMALGATALLGLGTRPAAVSPSGSGVPWSVADTTEPKRVLVTADFLERTVENDEAIRRLIGNVRGRQDSTYLFSDRAVEFEDRRTFLLTGRVLIVEQGDSLRADTVFYDERTKVGRARSRVRLSDGEVVVRAPSGIYYVDEKRALFEEGFVLQDSLAEMTSLHGTYWSDEKRAELDGDVQLQAERSYLEADSMTYFRETEVSIARHNVFIERIGGGTDDAEGDSTIRTLLFGQRAYNDEQAGRSRIQGRPLLLQLRQDSTGADVDTLIIQALQLEAVERDSVQRLIAVDSVQIWQSDFAAVADSVIYERITLATDTLEETRLYRHPMAWFEDAQVSGDTLRVKGRAGAVDSLFVRSQAFVAQRDTVLDQINQVRGQHLVGVFKDDSVRVFDIGPNAEVIRHRRDEDDRPDGALQASLDRLLLYLRGDDLERIEGLCPGGAQGCIQGTVYPEGLQPDPLQLDGFRWEPDRRPAKPGLLRDERVIARLERYAASSMQRILPARAAVHNATTDADSSNRNGRPPHR